MRNSAALTKGRYLSTALRCSCEYSLSLSSGQSCMQPGQKPSGHNLANRLSSKGSLYLGVAIAQQNPTLLRSHAVRVGPWGANISPVTVRGVQRPYYNAILVNALSRTLICIHRQQLSFFLMTSYGHHDAPSRLPFFSSPRHSLSVQSHHKDL